MDPPTTSDTLRQAAIDILVTIIQLPRGKTVSQDYYANQIMQLFAIEQRHLLERVLQELLERKKLYITELAWKHAASEEAVPISAVTVLLQAMVEEP